MSVNCHNSGKICWNLLADSLSYNIQKNWSYEYSGEGHQGKTKYIFSINNNKLEHFSNVMADVIKDFAETYKKEDRYELNPTKWEYENYMYSAGAQVSNADTLISSYIFLNLILLNSKLNETPLLGEEKNKWMYDVCSGDGDYRIDKYLASKFIKIRKRLFERYADQEEGVFKTRIKLSKELIEEIKDYLKEVFECLIRLHQSEKHRHTVSSGSIFYVIQSWMRLELK